MPPVIRPAVGAASPFEDRPGFLPVIVLEDEPAIPRREQCTTLLRPELEAEIRAAALAGVEQKEIIKATGYSREMVRLASISEEEREAERAKRRKR